MTRTLPIVPALVGSLLWAWQAPGATLKLLPLGDSITHGVASRGADGGYSYRYWLWRTFVDAGVDVDFVGSLVTPYDSPIDYPDYQGRTFDPDHEGHYGWSTRMILENLPSWLASYDVDTALVHLGHNDYWREIASGAATYADTESHLRSIIASLRADNPRVAILLAQVIPADPTAFPESSAFPPSHIDALYALAPLIAASESTPDSPVAVIDQRTDFEPVSMIYDGVHTNAIGEQRMADVWWGALVENVLANADFDENHTVDAADLAIWEAAFGAAQGASHAQGDADRNGAVDGSDFLLWQARFRLASMERLNSAQLPEPHAWRLIFAAWAVPYRHRRVPG